MNEQAHVPVPESVELVYRVVGKTHVFSSKGINGLVHVGHHDREMAFVSAISALNKHVSYAYGCEAVYRCTMDYSKFASHLDTEDDISGNFLTMTLEKGSSAH